MPHQCVRCGNFYDDGAQEIIKGCNCGSKLFFYIKKEKLDEMKNTFQENLNEDEKDQIEKDVFEIIGQNRDPDAPVILDIEAIKVVKPGKYELDLVHLFKNDPLIYKVEEGKYIIDISKSFGNVKKKPEQKLNK